jgi:hypothetical protein
MIEVAPRPRLTAGAFLFPIGDSLVSPERGPVSDTPKQQTRILSHPWAKDEQIIDGRVPQSATPLGKPHINRGYLDYGTKLRRDTSWQ